MRRSWAPIALFSLACLLLGLFPDSKPAIDAIRRGDTLFKNRRYSAALDAYTQAADRCPGCPQPHLRRGQVYLAQDRNEEAWPAYLEAIRLGGGSDEVDAALAHLYLNQNAPELAIGLLEPLLERRPGRADLWLQLAQTAQAQADLAPPQDWLATAQANLVAAQAAYERALTLNLADAQRQIVHDQLGILCLKNRLKNNLESGDGGALAHFQAAASGPDVTLAQQAAALAAALQSLEQQEEPAMARAKLGQALLAHGDLALARQQFEQAVALAPLYVDGHAYLGHTLSLLEENGLADLHLAYAIDLAPTAILPRYFLGMHDMRRGWWRTAQNILFQAYDLDPTNPAICAAIAETFLQGEERNYGAAERWLYAAVDKAPQDARFHLLLAHFYIDYGIDPSPRGVDAAQMALDLSPQNAEAQETLGWAYVLSGQAQMAIEPLLRARDLAPDTPRIYYRLGEAYRALGRWTTAQDFYQQALDLDWHGPIGTRARQALQDK